MKAKIIFQGLRARPECFHGDEPWPERRGFTLRFAHLNDVKGLAVVISSFKFEFEQFFESNKITVWDSAGWATCRVLVAWTEVQMFERIRVQMLISTSCSVIVDQILISPLIPDSWTVLFPTFPDWKSILNPPRICNALHSFDSLRIRCHHSGHPMNQCGPMLSRVPRIDLLPQSALFILAHTNSIEPFKTPARSIQWRQVLVLLMRLCSFHNESMACWWPYTTSKSKSKKRSLLSISIHPP